MVSGARKDELGMVGTGVKPLENPLGANPDVEGQEPAPEPVIEAPVKQRPKGKVVRANLTKEQKDEAVQFIKEEFVKIQDEYDKEEFLEKADKALKEYELSKEYSDFPTDNAANQKVALLQIAADITAAKAKRQVLTPRPMCLMEICDYDINQEMLRRVKEGLLSREDYLDHILRNDCKMEELFPIWARMACVQGTAIVKTPIEGETDWHISGEDEQGNPIEEKVRTFYGVRPYRVKLENFLARLSIKDFKKHKVIAEKLENFTHIDIEQRVESGFWNADDVEDLKAELGEKYYEEKFTFYECIVYKDLKEKGKHRRFLITFDDKTDHVVRDVYYPYSHAKINYSAICPIPRDDSWAGYSYWQRLEDVISICEKYIRYKINAFTLSHKPVAFIDDPQFDASRMTINKNINVFKVQKGTEFNQVRFDQDFGDSTQSIQFFMNFSELITGVSAALMSGRETPTDPRAPAAKTAMKLQESNMRIEDVVMNMQVGLADVFEQVDKDYYQFVNSEKETINYIDSENEQKTVEKDLFEVKVRYVVHGSRIAFDKSLDLQINLQTAEWIGKLFPELWADVEVKYVIAQNIINNSEGSVEKNKKTLLKPLELRVKAKNEAIEAMKAGMPMPGQEGQGMAPVGPGGHIPDMTGPHGAGMGPGGGRRDGSGMGGSI